MLDIFGVEEVRLDEVINDMHLNDPNFILFLNDGLILPIIDFARFKSYYLILIYYCVLMAYILTHR